MDTRDALQSFGLTHAEVSAYLILLRLGEATASEVSQQAGMNRTFTYDRLKKLSDSGLASSFIKDNKKYFRAAEPRHLLHLLKEREEQIRVILPELEKMGTLEQKKSPRVEVYSGIKGVKTVLDIVLAEHNPIYLYGSILQFQHSLPTYFEIWNTRRIAAKLMLNILSSETISLDCCKTDLLSEEEHTTTSLFTFGDWVVMVMWGSLPVAILIHSKEIASNQLSFFHALWDREVRIYSGADGILRAFFELLEDTREFVGFGFSKQLADVYTVERSNEWHIARMRLKIPARLVAYDEPQTTAYFGTRVSSKKSFLVHYLPRDLQGPACISLSDNKVATFVYTEKKFRVIVNSNKETVRVYKKYFEELWRKSHR